MEFDVKVWRDYYDKVNIIGKKIKDSYPDSEGNPPKSIMFKGERMKLLDEIKELTYKSNMYLDKCNMQPNQPKWIYNRFNETTWASSEKFIFNSLMPKRKYLSIPFYG